MSSPAPGWYPAPHANNEQRYWDGTRWLEPVPETPAPTTHSSPTGASGASRPGAGMGRKVWIIVGSVAAAVTIVAGAGAAVGLGLKGSRPTTPSAVSAPQKPAQAETPAQIRVPDVIGMPVSEAIAVVEDAGFLPPRLSFFEDPGALVVSMSREPGSQANEGAAISFVVEEAAVIVPDVVGLPVADAIAALASVGLTPPLVTSFEDPAAAVASTSPAAGSEAKRGQEITVVAVEKPKLTLSQQNAISKAKSYLDFMAFSRTGLIDQLEYEGFGTEDATFGVDNAGADWNAQAAKKAQSYLDMMAFSRSGLYDQLAYEGFQPAEIEFGLAAVGY
ncbi:Ltp family lipoprotein [Microbacterium sp. 179-I 3D4 NHS]|uniref:Ltp family lipoprotein n=1 Tax=Microbacterium sp. 179-I 3D4 NHS TaxID=3142381 RepID=UPI0039A376D6